VSLLSTEYQTADLLTDRLMPSLTAGHVWHFVATCFLRFSSSVQLIMVFYMASVNIFLLVN